MAWIARCCRRVAVTLIHGLGTAWPGDVVAGGVVATHVFSQVSSPQQSRHVAWRTRSAGTQTPPLAGPKVSPLLLWLFTAGRCHEMATPAWEWESTRESRGQECRRHSLGRRQSCQYTVPAQALPLLPGCCHHRRTPHAVVRCRCGTGSRCAAGRGGEATRPHTQPGSY